MLHGRPLFSIEELTPSPYIIRRPHSTNRVRFFCIICPVVWTARIIKYFFYVSLRRCSLHSNRPYMYILYYVLYFVKIPCTKKFSVILTKVHVINVSGNYIYSNILHILLHIILHKIYSITGQVTKTTPVPSLYSTGRPHPTSITTYIT